MTATLMRALWVQQSSLSQARVQYADERGTLVVVADVVGGCEGGEKACALSGRVIENFLLNALRWLLALNSPVDASVLREFKAALQSADASVYAAAASDRELRGMATTLTMAYSCGNALFVAHAAGSRCYLLRCGALQRLTHDDALVSQMVESGVLAPESAAVHDLRNVITNFIGGARRGVRAEVHQMKLEAGDVLLLCTDGLSEMVKDEQIASVIGSRGPQQACVNLVRIASDDGGRDNVTVVVARHL